MPKKFISNQALKELLKKATYEEKLSLTKLLYPDLKKPFNDVTLQKEICNEGGHGVINMWRGQGTGYLDIADEVADELNIQNIPSYNYKVKYFEEVESLRYDWEASKAKGVEYAELVEEKVIIKLLEMIYEPLDDDKKKEFDQQITEVAKQFDSNITKNLTGTAGLMVLGNLGGFATYTFLTTALSTISMGTLGFGVYTAATSLLSVMLGPLGWAGLGLIGLYALGKPNYEKLIPIVAIIGAIRQRIKYEQREK